jgi:REP element-mobilizing transposase RayT
MSRTRRLFLPRAAFHITARTQGGAKWFVPEMRHAIVDDVEQAVSSFGHNLLAYVVMPNHLHIVLQQGTTPLGWVMQRILQKTVMRVRHMHGCEGHVFGRPYWSATCANPAYVRRAIVYTHLNPLKAELCTDIADYPWSSHNLYMCAATPRADLRWSPMNGLMLFAHNSARVVSVVDRYKLFVDYCIERRRIGIPGDWLLPQGANRLLIPSASHGDSHWASHYSHFAESESFTRPSIDVTRLATSLLSRIDPALDLETLQIAGASKRAAPVRNQLIAGLITAGCKKSGIARCLRVSASTVSRIATAMRFGDAAEDCSMGPP